MMRASVESFAAAVTRITKEPVWLTVPAKTGSPTALSTGMLSPVTLAWSTALLPDVTRPSRGTRSPGLMRTMASMAIVFDACLFHLPSGCFTSASSGASAISPLMALRARSTARASISSAMA